MVLPVSHRVSRAPWYSGADSETQQVHLRGYHALWLAFPGHSILIRLSYSVGLLPYSPFGPTTPSVQRRQAFTQKVWALPRSLATTCGISDLISFPQGTEMFQFPWLAFLTLCIQMWNPPA